jgi:F420-dependent oxidoreductase-like protein
MKLGMGLGYWSSGPPPGQLESVVEADRLGYDSLWTAEAYGSDALTPLAFYGSHTTRMKLASGICQMPARTPTAVAMAAMTLDHLSGGRMVLGLGASGPQVVEGWYGQPYPKPLARTREYFEIVRATLRRDVVEFDGDFYQLPLAGGSGLGKKLKSTIHPKRPDLPVYLGAEGPKNVALAGEIADGWVAMLYSPNEDKWYRDRLAEGFVKRSAERSPAEGFEVACLMPAVINPDLEQAADMIRPFLALYAGGMGAKGANFHHEAIARSGWEAEAVRIQELYLEGRKQEAAASIPVKMVEDFALIGPPDKIKADMARWEETAITTMIVNGPPVLLRALAEIVL